MCDGRSAQCPVVLPPLLTSGECIINLINSKGECNEKGVCASVCGDGTLPCSCTGADACKVCCIKLVIGGKCEPRVPLLNQVDGVSCNGTDGNIGYCSEQSGKCEVIQRDVKERFGDLFTDFTLNKALKWMQNNIVFTVLVLSLIVWVPAAVVVTLIERKEDREYAMLVKSDENNSFTRDDVST